MSEQQIKQSICEVGQKLYDKGFVAANDGNISVRVSPNEIIVTPTGVSKGGMSPCDMVKVSLDGEVVEGTSVPSSEVKMHLQIYRENAKVNAVVHAHPPISTAFACARKPMESPILAEAIVNLGVVPVANFALPGTTDLPKSISNFSKSYNAVLMSNHGLLTWGADITEAYFRMESVEHFGKILLYTQQIGGAVELSQAEISNLLDIRAKLGIETGGKPVSRSCHEG